MIVSIFYLILKFTRISEFGNDIPAIIFSILSIFYFFKFIEEKEIIKKKDYFFYNLSFAVFAILIKFSSIPIIIISIFYNLSSNLKNLYLGLKSNYTEDKKYLAVITNNGLWIKDNVKNNINIINASKIDDIYLLNASITELDSNFNVKRHIQSEKIDISSKNWIIFT